MLLNIGGFFFRPAKMSMSVRNLLTSALSVATMWTGHSAASVRTATASVLTVAIVQTWMNVRRLQITANISAKTSLGLSCVFVPKDISRYCKI